MDPNNTNTEAKSFEEFMVGNGLKMDTLQPNPLFLNMQHSTQLPPMTLASLSFPIAQQASSSPLLTSPNQVSLQSNSPLVVPEEPRTAQSSLSSQKQDNDSSSEEDQQNQSTAPICCIKSCTRKAKRKLSSIRGEPELKEAHSGRVCEAHYRSFLREYKKQNDNIGPVKSPPLKKRRIQQAQPQPQQQQPVSSPSDSNEEQYSTIEQDLTSDERTSSPPAFQQQDAVMYVDQIKNVFADQPHVFNEFASILNEYRKKK